MRRLGIKSLFLYEGDAFLTWLHQVEHTGARMIAGIGSFIGRRIPELLRDLLEWLNDKAIYAIRVSIRLGRVLAVFAAWLGILIGPLIIHPGFLTLMWSLIALMGSFWGLRRQIRNQRADFSGAKGASNA